MITRQWRRDYDLGKEGHAVTSDGTQLELAKGPVPWKREVEKVDGMKN